MKKILLWIVTLVAIVVLVFILWKQLGSNKDVFMEMVYVKGGTFTMGASQEQIDMGYDNEKPAHEVTLSSFYMGKYPVTVAQYARFVDETGYLTEAERGNCKFLGKPWYGTYVVGANGVTVMCETSNWRCDVNGKIRDSSTYNHPVAHIGQRDAMAFCEWLSGKEGKTYRLPTEAEWEYAARGGVKSTPTLYSGSDILDEVGWYINNSDRTTHPVGMKKPNELGIYDMSGLVWEWCSDFYTTYSSEPQTNPKGPESAEDDRMRVICRGGTINRYESYCRVSNRSPFQRINRSSGSGFRVVCEEEPPR